jgi:hypothetical protein
MPHILDLQWEQRHDDEVWAVESPGDLGHAVLLCPNEQLAKHIAQAHNDWLKRREEQDRINREANSRTEP